MLLGSAVWRPGPPGCIALPPSLALGEAPSSDPGSAISPRSPGSFGGRWTLRSPGQRWVRLLCRGAATFRPARGQSWACFHLKIASFLLGQLWGLWGLGAGVQAPLPCAAPALPDTGPSRCCCCSVGWTSGEPGQSSRDTPGQHDTPGKRSTPDCRRLFCLPTTAGRVGTLPLPGSIITPRAA